MVSLPNIVSISPCYTDLTEKIDLKFRHMVLLADVELKSSAYSSWSRLNWFKFTMICRLELFTFVSVWSHKWCDCTWLCPSIYRSVVFPETVCLRYVRTCARTYRCSSWHPVSAVRAHGVDIRPGGRPETCSGSVAHNSLPGGGLVEWCESLGNQEKYACSRNDNTEFPIIQATFFYKPSSNRCPLIAFK